MTGAAFAPAPEEDGGLESLLASFVTLLPVDEAAASTLNNPFDNEMLVATSARAGALDDAQIDLGEGPAWTAYQSLRPVQVHVADPTEATSWPFFAPALETAGVRSVVSVPLLLGSLGIGAVSLYCGRPTVLEAEDLRLAMDLARILARSIVAEALERAQSGHQTRDATLSRREVHQATGMVFSQTGSSPEDALLMIRAHAFATGTSVRGVAAQIVARELDFTPDVESDDGK